jgi:predicted nucleic acid-binding protein/uncharacterized protein (DUF983 family)
MSDTDLSPDLLRDAFRSDALENIRALVDHLEASTEGKHGEVSTEQIRPYEIDLILDANAALKEIYWIVDLREDPNARTAIQECVSAGTINLYAPDYLDEEVREKIPEVAERNNVAEDELYSEWEGYKSYIDFQKVSDKKLEVAGREIDVIDSEDLPYIAFQVDLETAVVSDDDHVQEMGEAVLIDGVRGLREYSRAASVKYHITMAGTLVGILSFKALGAVWNGVSYLLSALVDAPRWLQFAVTGTLMLAAINSTSRRKVKEALSSLTSVSGDVLKELIPVLEAFVLESEKADEMLEEFRSSRVLPQESANFPHGGSAEVYLSTTSLHNGRFSRPPRMRKENSDLDSGIDSVVEEKDPSFVEASSL